MTYPFRVPLALAELVTRRGHSDSALAEPVAHIQHRQSQWHTEQNGNFLSNGGIDEVG